MQIHIKDRENLAKNLDLSLEDFDNLVSSANEAYEIIKDYGPFYGNESIKEPTFRITAKPIELPIGSKSKMELLGNDLLHLGKALQNLPLQYKEELGHSVDFRIPPTWRVDAIITEEDTLKVNEIEGLDSADALMIVEQIAYRLQTMNESTAAKLIPTLKKMCLPQKDDNYKIAFIRKVLPFNPHTPNDHCIIEFIKKLSKNTVLLDLLDRDSLKNGDIKPEWSTYAGVINQSSLSPEELLNFGISNEQIISTGNYCALVNKSVMALVFDTELAMFWSENLGEERWNRLKDILIPTSLVKTVKDLHEARESGKVVKIAWADSNTTLINRSNGVALPQGLEKHISEDRWEMLQESLQEGCKVIAQDFVMPAQISSYLRKKGTNLEHVSWYNRVCVKYVCEGNPNAQDISSVATTAVEVTLGPDVVPAGRKSAFTAGKLA